jgi:hypothetical protein
MKSTSTPWYVSNAYGNGSAIWIAPKEGPKMVLQGASCLRSDSVKYDEINIEQLQNNARLMAAAPELLAALEELVAEADNPHGWDGHTHPHTGGFRMARDILSKLKN